MLLKKGFIRVAFIDSLIATQIGFIAGDIAAAPVIFIHKAGVIEIVQFFETGICTAMGDQRMPLYPFARIVERLELPETKKVPDAHLRHFHHCLHCGFGIEQNIKNLHAVMRIDPVGIDKGGCFYVVV
jgi:hypothetical protein